MLVLSSKAEEAPVPMWRGDRPRPVFGEGPAVEIPISAGRRRTREPMWLRALALAHALRWSINVPERRPREVWECKAISFIRLTSAKVGPIWAAIAAASTFCWSISTELGMG